MTELTDSAIAELIITQLPRLLTERPELDTQLYQVFVRHFVDRGEWGRFRQEMTEFQAETKANFEKIDQRFDKVETDIAELRTEMRHELKAVRQEIKAESQIVRTELQQEIALVHEKVDNLHNIISRIGRRWGIRNEDLFRQTIKALLEKSFGVTVESRFLGPDDEQFDLIISNGDHILIEVAASVKRNILDRLERKRTLYYRETNIRPSRFILAVGSIHSRRAEALRQAGFEVIEPEDEDDY